MNIAGFSAIAAAFHIFAPLEAHYATLFFSIRYAMMLLFRRLLRRFLRAMIRLGDMLPRYFSPYAAAFSCCHAAA